MDLWDFTNRLRRGFSRETSELPHRWTLENPSVGQCHVTALLIQKNYGGIILSGHIHPPGSYLAGVAHFWNSIQGSWVDATRDQFPISYELSDIVPAGDPLQDTIHKAGLLLLAAGLGDLHGMSYVGEHGPELVS